MSETRERYEDKTRGEKHRLLCATCRIPTMHLVIASRNIVTHLEEGTFSRTDEDDYEIVECQNCAAVTFRHAHRDSETSTEDNEPETQELLFPPRRPRSRLMESLVGVPWPLSDTFRETVEAMDEGKERLTAMGIRTCLEQICLDKGVAGGNLKAKIEALQSAGEVSSQDAAMLQLLRTEIGNPAAHEARGPTRAQVATAFHVLESLVHRLYILPQSTDGLRRRVP